MWLSRKHINCQLDLFRRCELCTVQCNVFIMNSTIFFSLFIFALKFTKTFIQLFEGNESFKGVVKCRVPKFEAISSGCDLCPNLFNCIPMFPL